MDIKRMAREAGFSVDGDTINDGIETTADFAPELARFAALVVEECAKVVDHKYKNDWTEAGFASYPPTGKDYAAAIRSLTTRPHQ